MSMSLGRILRGQVRWLHGTRVHYNDEKLLKSILKEENQGERKSEFLGPEYWKKEYTGRLKQARKGLDEKLEEKFAKTLDKVKSYNARKLPLERLRVDMSKKYRMRDLLPNARVGRAAETVVGSSSPTDFQKRFWASMSSGLSTIAKGDQGSGRSFAIVVSALATRRNQRRGSGINTLILVKSERLVEQYRQVVESVVTTMGKIATPKVAQYLYRSTEEEESKQNAVLAGQQTPHILVTTPQRLLDLLSTRGMGFVQVNNLGSIFVDDFDAMVGEDYLESEKKAAPVVKLLNYVIKLQDYMRQHKESHPQIAFTVSNTCSEALLEQIKEKTRWFDWDRFVELGTFDAETAIPTRKSVATNVGVSSVLVSPSLNGKKFKVELYDMVPFEYGADISSWLDKLYRSLEGSDWEYRKQRHIKRAKMGKEVKRAELEVLVRGFVKLSKKVDLDGALLVHTDDVSSNQVKALLKKKAEKVTLINSSALTGVTFKGLSKIVLLGIDSIKDVPSFVSICGRCRKENGGVIDEKLFPAFTEEPSGELASPENRVYLVNSMLDFGIPERRYLERMLIKTGLVQQFASVGVEEYGFDKERYLAESVATEYEICT